MPTSNASRMDASVNSSVRGKRSRSIPETVVFCVSDVPRSPCATPISHAKYCCGSGRSSPIFCRTASICASLAKSPRKIRTGSPGTACSNANTSVAAPTAKARAMINRRSRYWITRDQALAILQRASDQATSQAAC